MWTIIQIILIQALVIEVFHHLLLCAEFILSLMTTFLFGFSVEGFVQEVESPAMAARGQNKMKLCMFVFLSFLTLKDLIHP